MITLNKDYSSCTAYLIAGTAAYKLGEYLAEVEPEAFSIAFLNTDKLHIYFCNPNLVPNDDSFKVCKYCGVFCVAAENICSTPCRWALEAKRPTQVEYRFARL